MYDTPIAFIEKYQTINNHNDLYIRNINRLCKDLNFNYFEGDKENFANALYLAFTISNRSYKKEKIILELVHVLRSRYEDSI